MFTIITARFIEEDPSWILQDATFEKMGALTADNDYMDYTMN